MINTPSMPVTAEPGVYDTRKVYGVKNVSFGDSYSEDECGIEFEF